ncbi:ABC transporter permease [Enterococcus villorum]|uniref:Transport permease protein n=2 Tax=Enterococcus villorum TaxID=112904 RepID=A0A511J229_9ENTE|nr:ABC transporter permease [Enterococcus villorum]EOH92554.1 hypothetical protein UAO_00440 [Enterococcus villorum ATCC 700913]EOW75657.1 hypothetical protein I591_02750 [Enterococcus villorum ATCC 700913]GEL92077.1 transport permease protein [Enterococcus villorum]
MNNVWDKIEKKIKSYRTIYYLSKFEKRNIYSGFRIGLLWDFLNPLIQIMIYYFVFNIRLGSDRFLSDNIPYIFWLIGGLIPWLFMNATIVQGSKSMLQKISLATRVGFPSKVLPMITLYTNLSRFLLMLLIFTGLLIINQVPLTLYILQLFYYIPFMIFFLYSLTLLLSILTIIFRDMTNIISSMMKILFYMSGITVVINSKENGLIDQILALNPINYFIEGIRHSFLSTNLFYENKGLMLFMITSTLLIYLTGILLYKKYQEKLFEYL